MDLSSHFRRPYYPDLLAAGPRETSFLSYGLGTDFIERLGAWLSASHLERDPKKPAPPTP